MLVYGVLLDINWLVQFILSAVIISLGFLWAKKRVPSSFNTHEVNQSSEAWKGGQSVCSFCGDFRAMARCSRCKAARYCSGLCQLKHWRNGHKEECIERNMPTDQKESSCTANNEREQPRNDNRTTMPGDINIYDGFGFSREKFSLFSASSPEEGTTNTNPKPLVESSEEVQEQTRERVRYLEEELAKAKNKIGLLQSECNNWVTRTSFVSRRLNTFMRESDQHQITKEAGVAVKREQDQDYVQKLERECSKAKKELQEERKRVQRFILERLEIKQNFTSKLEEATLTERKKQEKYIQMLENAEDARALEMMQQEEHIQTMESEWAKAERKWEEEAQAHIQTLKNECAKMKRELQEERKLVQRLKLKQDEAQIAERKLEEIAQELTNARNDVQYATSRADVAENEWIKAKRQLQEEEELVHLLKLECDETRQTAMRHVEEKELDLADAIIAAKAAESRAASAEYKAVFAESRAAAAEAKISDLEKEIKSSDDKACAICLSNEKDMAFGCGHMTCRDCGSTMSMCPICRQQITSRLRLFL